MFMLQSCNVEISFFFFRVEAELEFMLHTIFLAFEQCKLKAV